MTEVEDNKLLIDIGDIRLWTITKDEDTYRLRKSECFYVGHFKVRHLSTLHLTNKKTEIRGVKCENSELLFLCNDHEGIIFDTSGHSSSIINDIHNMIDVCTYGNLIYILTALDKEQPIVTCYDELGTELYKWNPDEKSFLEGLKSYGIKSYNMVAFNDMLYFMSINNHKIYIYSNNGKFLGVCDDIHNKHLRYVLAYLYINPQGELLVLAGNTVFTLSH